MDFYVSDGVKVIIAIALGILLFLALNYIFKNQLITGLENGITQLFNYSNGSLT